MARGCSAEREVLAARLDARLGGVNLGGGGWPDRFYAGGWIDTAGQPIERLVLRFANGIALDGDTSGNVALFHEGRVRADARDDRDARCEGSEIMSHLAFPGV